MQRLTLLERISNLERNKFSHVEQYSLEQSILRHLSDMLNTRRGTVPIAPDYGIADVTDLGKSFSQESINQFTNELENVVLRYEPRLESITITYNNDDQTPLSAQFKVEAQLTKELGSQRLSFETTLDASGNMRFIQEDY